MTVEWTDVPRGEEYQASLTWIPVSRGQPHTAEWIWVQLKSGLVALGYREGPWWITDGFRVKDSYDSVIRWADIEYPQGPVYIP